MADVWAQARTIRDLAQGYARWLGGEIPSSAGHEPGAGPDEETRELIPTLIAANHAGYATFGSQPGGIWGDYDLDGEVWEQRAFVDGWIEPELAPGFRDTMRAAGLWVVEGDHHFIDLTRINGELVTGRARIHHDDYADILDGCSPEAVQAARDAEQISVVDGTWGRNDRLWPALGAWVACHG